MTKPLYITQYGELRREDNTLYFVGKTIEKTIPVKQVSEIHCTARVTLTSGAIDLLSIEGIPVHFYTKEGFYKGSFLPKSSGNGRIKIAQVQHYLDKEKRLYIATQIVKGMKNSMLKSLKGHDSRRIKDIEINADDLGELLGIEALLWEHYYKFFAKTVKMEFRRRTRRPPRDEVNSLISFGNSLLYGITLSSIVKARLDPDISFLHEPKEGRFSLSLDLSEPFKPLIVMSIVRKVVNKKIITQQHFRKQGGVYLNAEGRKKIYSSI